MTFVHPERGTTVRVMVIDEDTDPVTQILTEVWRFVEIDESGEVVRDERERLHLRWLYRYETHHLLRLSGFEIVAEYSDFDRSPPAYGAEQIWVARPSRSGSLR